MRRSVLSASSLSLALVSVTAVFMFGVSPASAGSFVCIRAITSAQATAILGVPARVVTGGGGEDDCGIDARGFNHIIVTGYVVKRSFFDDLRRRTRSGTYNVDGTRTVHTQRTLHGFGGPAFSLETKSFYENAPGGVVITRSVFVYRNGRMLRPISSGPKKLASVAQLVRIARLAARGI